MRVLITGGSGLIGRSLAGDLAGAGHSVTVLTRSPGRLRGLPDFVQAVAWDGRTAAGWADQAEGVDAIVNLAGESIAGENVAATFLGRWTAEKKRRIVQSRANAGRAVADAVDAAASKPAVVIQMSGVGYYGAAAKGELDEGAPAGSDFLAHTCAAWEAATDRVEQLGVRRVVLRTAVVLTRQGGVLPLMLLPFRLFLGGPLGGGQQPFPWVHIDDVIGAIRFAIENRQVRGVANLVAPSTPTNAEFSRLVGTVLHRPSWLPVPAFALRLLLGEKATIVLDGQRPVPKRLLSLGYRFRFHDPKTALEDLLR